MGTVDWVGRKAGTSGGLRECKGSQLKVLPEGLGKWPHLPGVGWGGGGVGGHHPSEGGACRGWRSSWAWKGPPNVLLASGGRKSQLQPESYGAERSSSGLRNVCSLGGERAPFLLPLLPSGERESERLILFLSLCSLPASVLGPHGFSVLSPLFLFLCLCNFSLFLPLPFPLLGLSPSPLPSWRRLKVPVAGVPSFKVKQGCCQGAGA